MGGKSSVHTVGIFALWLHKTGMQAKQGRKIVERHFSKDLLHNERTLFRMEVCECKGIFQIPKRSFNTPAFVVKHTEQRGRKAVCGKVRDHGLIQAFFDLKSYDPERKRIQVVTCISDIVKLNLAGKPAVLLRLLPDTVRQAVGE